ncbi:amidohydrolase family protein [Rudaea cellulosilytica]|uniref:amidohydrolase family protein n=1 Tax=Rudaea cellulosilytica TaxID=540746 RepID=UPI0012FB834A|nr:amidohydrolase family protein [Rudaea cellulosilytica]
MRPERIVRSASKPTFAIDVHAHFFNASDVNVAGFVSESVAHAMDEPSRSFAIALSGVLDSLAGTASTAQDEYATLLKKAGSPQDFSATDMQKALDNEIDARQQDIANRLYNEMVRQRADAAFKRAAQNDQERSASPNSTPELSPESILDAMQSGIRVTARSANNTKSAPDGKAKGLLRFAGYMLQERWMNLRLYSQAYSSSDNAFGIDAAFGALVDFDYWFDCSCHSARRDQMKIQSLLSHLSGGYMLPLISYNPWTDIKDNGASFSLVVSAIEEYGFIGVKIYPPMGFFAYGNSNTPVKTKYARPDLTQLDAKLAQLFDWCTKNNVPVMAHTNASLGRDTASDSFGGVRGWSALLARYAGQPSSPLVNLGHFGGDIAEMGSQWPTDFAKLMAKAPNNRLYGDLAYWSAARECLLQGSPLCTDLRNRLKSAESAYPGLRDRLMYGSDWVMLSQEQDWKIFPQEIALATSNDTTLTPEGLFYRNALECFGLTRTGFQHDRIIARLGLAPEEVPAWLNQ